VNSDTKSNLGWRRSKVLELASQGLNQSEISRTLQISQPTINRDLSFLRQQAKQKIRSYIDERLPEEYEKCLVGINSIVKEAWTTSQQTHDRREKIQALSLAKDCYAMKLELLTNATVVDDAIRFLTGHEKSVSNISSNVGTISGALKDKTDTAQGIQESECTHTSRSTTANQVF
jgi:DeoR/GlpR family transcriptional regulator of sugar metabolism